MGRAKGLAALLGAWSDSPNILGIEIGATVVRAVVLSTGSLEVTAAAEAGIDTPDESLFDAATIRPALGEVMYQLAALTPEAMLTAISIGPPQSGVGSGPALSTWLKRQARSLDENLICSGGLGVAFCPQTPVDLLISLSEEAAITLARVDLAPVAAARTLPIGSADTVMLGSGRGWRARLRDGEVLEAVHAEHIDVDQPMSVLQAGGHLAEIPSYFGVRIAPELNEAFELNLGQLAPAVGAAVGLIEESGANLLDGKLVFGRGVYATGEHRFSNLVGDDGTVTPNQKPLPTTGAGADETAVGGTAQHVFNADDLAPLDPGEATVQLSSRQGLAPNPVASNSTRGSATAEPAYTPMRSNTDPVANGAGDFDDSPMVVDRRHVRTPLSGSGDGKVVDRIGRQSSQSFPIMVVVLLVAIAAVAMFLLAS